MENCVSLKLDFNRECNSEDNELLIFSTVQRQNVQITSFALYS